MHTVEELTELIMKKFTLKNVGYGICSMVSFIFWRLDSGYKYIYKILGINYE